MASRLDSSPQHPIDQHPIDQPAIHQHPIDKPEGESPDDRRRRLLSAERIHNSIRKVARSHGVPNDQVEDVLHDTIERAMRARLPDSDAEATKYVNAIAKRVAFARMGNATAIQVEPYEENPDEESRPAGATAGVPPPPFEIRDAIHE